MKNLLLKILFVLTIALLFESCKVDKYLTISDGSKADGTISMFYDLYQFQKPIVHLEEAKRDATLKCQNWGYKRAELFGSGIRECLSYNEYGDCRHWRVYYKYQCIE